MVGAITSPGTTSAAPFTPLELETHAADRLAGRRWRSPTSSSTPRWPTRPSATRSPVCGTAATSRSRSLGCSPRAARLRPASAGRSRPSCSTSTTSAQFNKQHGHTIGDAVLRAFGSILSRRLRSSDIVARFGGEEFVAVLDGASVEEAQRVADEIRRELEAVAITGADGERLRATVSAGCASLGPDVASLEALLEVADVGLQMAKRGGRNQVVAA